jgi:hypothetical protein
MELTKSAKSFLNSLKKCLNWAEVKEHQEGGKAEAYALVSKQIRLMERARRDGNPELALLHSQSALKAAEKHFTQHSFYYPTLLYKQGRIYEEMGKPMKSVETFVRAAHCYDEFLHSRHNRYSADVFLAITRVCLEMGNNDLGHRAFQFVGEMYNNMPDVPRSTRYYEMKDKIDRIFPEQIQRPLAEFAPSGI